LFIHKTKPPDTYGLVLLYFWSVKVVVA